MIYLQFGKKMKILNFFRSNFTDAIGYSYFWNRYGINFGLDAHNRRLILKKSFVKFHQSRSCKMANFTVNFIQLVT